MQVTDTIADMLTRINNARRVYHEEVNVPHSKMKERIAEILDEEGFITGYQVENKSPQKNIRIRMKYGPDREQVINGLDRVSKSGLRVYRGKEELPQVLGGLGIAIISTSHGILTDKEARKLGVGGEVLCYIW